jgi:hypothetical protein
MTYRVALINEYGPEYAPWHGVVRWKGSAFSAVLILAIDTLACASRIGAPNAPGAPGEPRASWIIRAGSVYGAEREVCRSGLDQTCEIPASTEKQPVSVVVSVYLYPAGGEETTYRGAFLAGFMGSGSGGHETKVDYRIKQDERPSFVASAGRVTRVPGDYQFRMALFAEVPGQTDPHQFQQTIPVRVVDPRGT